MPSNNQRVKDHSKSIIKKFNGLEKALEQLEKKKRPAAAAIPRTTSWSNKECATRRQFLKEQGFEAPYIFEEKLVEDYKSFQGNIENFIGFAKIPMGIAGPLRVNGLHANGDFYIPLATSEGALVASISRGCQIISDSGGARVMVLAESVSRAPVFVFKNLVESARFAQWVATEIDQLKKIVKTKTSHGQLKEVQTSIIGKCVHLIFVFTTGDASGQNMVTICTDAIRQYIVETSPVKPKSHYIEGNMSGDKKPTMMSFLNTRGKKVCAEIEIPREVFTKTLRATPEQMMAYWKASFTGGVQSGSIGVQGHFANALAAMFLACGQDVACVSEASVGITSCDVSDDGDMYMSVTLPNLIVGTIGGGCSLPTQRESMQLLGCTGSNTARKFAEICAATVLAGEISIMGAITAGHFTRAHAVYGRKRKK